MCCYLFNELVSHYIRVPLKNHLLVSLPAQVLTPIGMNSFLSDDFGLLESVEYEQRIKYILEIIEEVEWKDIDPDELTRYPSLFVIVVLLLM